MSSRLDNRIWEACQLSLRQFAVHQRAQNRASARSPKVNGKEI